MNQNGREKITPSSKSIAQFKGAVDLSGGWCFVGDMKIVGRENNEKEGQISE